jgi:lysozyme
MAFLSSCDEQTQRKDEYSVHGIDVSHHQKQIDWQVVAGQGISFVFMKATEGATFQDSLFCKNWDAAKMANIRRGAYHFFRPSVPAEIQAANFLNWVNMETGDLFPVLDVEVTDGLPEIAVRQGISTWLSIVESSLGVKPVLYSNQKFFNAHLANHFLEYPVWIARYNPWLKPHLQNNRQWQFWQYGNRGQLQGIAGAVDFNVFRGTITDLDYYSYIKPAPPVIETPAEPTAGDITSNP